MLRFVMVGALVNCLCGVVMGEQAFKMDMVLYKQKGHYAAFPSLQMGPEGRLWIGFNWNSTGSHYGKAAGGQTGHVDLFSPDAGMTWYQKGADKQYIDNPTQGGFVLSDGSIITVSTLMHEILPAERKDELVKRGIGVKEWPDGHISASYRVRIRHKKPPSEEWETRYLVSGEQLPAFGGIGGWGQGCVLPGDTILKPVYGAFVEDRLPRAWVLRSTDNGQTWQLVTVAQHPHVTFAEPEAVCLPGGRILAILRADGGDETVPSGDKGFLWQCHSDDAGKTWSIPERTAMWGFPATLLVFPNGDVLCTYGYRRNPYGIRACFSRDGGKTWDTKNEVILRTDGKGHGGNMGYPRTVLLPDGSLFTAYYLTTGDRITHIAATKWSRHYLGPKNLARGEAAAPRADPSLPAEHIIGETAPVRLAAALMQTFIPTQPQVKMIAVRLSRENGKKELVHTNGLIAVVRKVQGNSWWTSPLGSSAPLKPQDAKIGTWNAFVFAEPVKVTPGEIYALTIYNQDYNPGPKPALKKGLSGNHSWYINAGPGDVGDYPNGEMSPYIREDIAFKVYSEIGPLPTK